MEFEYLDRFFSRYYKNAEGIPDSDKVIIQKIMDNGGGALLDRWFEFEADSRESVRQVEKIIAAEAVARANTLVDWKNEYVAIQHKYYDCIQESKNKGTEIGKLKSEVYRLKSELRYCNKKLSKHPDRIVQTIHSPFSEIHTALETVNNKIDLLREWEPYFTTDITVQVTEETLHTRQLLESKLVDMDLSVRALNCLKAAEVETLGELVSYTKSDLMKIRWFGKKSLTELEELVHAKGLNFGFDVARYGLGLKKNRYDPTRSNNLTRRL